MLSQGFPTSVVAFIPDDLPCVVRSHLNPANANQWSNFEGVMVWARI